MHASRFTNTPYKSSASDAHLKDKVRLCSGQTDGWGHTWLQVYFNDKWNDYEATFDPLKRKDKIDFNNLDAKFTDQRTLNLGGYDVFSYVQFEDGKLVNHTDVLGSIKSGVGLTDLLNGLR